MKTVFTIGYEKASIEDFVATLEAAHVDTLIDIRDVPVSRRRGFSKKALEEVLGSAGIHYVHLRALGDPKAGRDAARRGAYEEFRKIYTTHLAGEDAQRALTKAIEISSKSGACLLCYERDNKHCHRQIVADAMTDLGEFAVKHLGVREGMANGGGDWQGGDLRAVG